MNEDLLSTLESLLMTAILLQHNNAYGAAIFDRADELARPARVSYGSLYPTLERLEKKGFLKSKFGDPIPERGGKSRRYFSVNAAGRAALQRSDALADKIRAGRAEAWGAA
jgi:DNA-binding PadR family transcriptional regulator